MQSQWVSVASIATPGPDDERLALLQSVWEATPPEERRALVETRLADPWDRFPEDGWTALHRLAWNGADDAVRWLVQSAGADVNAKDLEVCRVALASTVKHTGPQQGSTALHMAAASGNLQMVKCLVEVGANVEAKDAEGNTAFQTVMRNSRTLDVAKYLADEAGASVNTHNSQGWSPLHEAVSRDEEAAVRFLMARKASVVAKTTRATDWYPAGLTPLDIAVRNHCQPIVALLQAPDSAQKASCQDRWLEVVKANPIDLDALKSVWEATPEEERKGLADTDTERYGHHITALHLACEKSSVDVVRWLVEVAGADPNSRSSDGTMPLHEACVFARLEAVKYLVEEAGCDVEAGDHSGWTALHYAVHASHSNNHAVVEYLLRHGADRHARISREYDDGYLAAGSTVIDLARYDGRSAALITLLETFTE